MPGKVPGKKVPGSGFSKPASLFILLPSSVPHHLITSSPYHLITSSPHYLITSSPHYLITSSPYFFPANSSRTSLWSDPERFFISSTFIFILNYCPCPFIEKESADRHYAVADIKIVKPGMETPLVHEE